MPGSFHGISIASTALRAFQRALDVTGHNITNVNTRGYSRQVVDFKQLEPTAFYSDGRHTLGNGVAIASIFRARDAFMEMRRREAESDMGRLSTLTTGMQAIEGALLEPGNSGVSAALGRFFDAWSGMASNPGNASAQMAVQTAGRTLTDRVRGTFQALTTLRDQTADGAREAVRQIETHMRSIAGLNTEIRQRVALGETPNDLLDLRDVAAQGLASLVNIKTSIFEDGSMTVYSGNLTLVDPTGVGPGPLSVDTATGALTLGSVSTTPTGGTLRGQLDSIALLNDYRGRLDLLANTLRTQVNAMHMTGVTTSGATGLRFFNDVVPPNPQSGAIDFALDTDGVVGPPAAPGVGTNAASITSGTSGNAGDGGLALAISQIRDVAQASLGNRSFLRFYSDFVGDVGREAQFQATAMDTQSALTQQLDNQIQSISGVSLDDEMANMLRFQRSYQAAARVLATFDQVTEELVTMLRR